MNSTDNLSTSSSSSSSSSGEDDQQIGLLRNRRNWNSMEARAEHLRLRNYRTLFTITTTIGIGLIVMVLSWLIKYRGGFSWSNPKLQFNWHPLLMLIGMLFLYGQSILIYRTFRNTLKKRIKLVHTFIHLTTFILIVIGLKAAFDSHNYAKPPIANLYSMHSWLGIIAVILFTGQFLFGFISFLYPGISRTLRAAILPVHAATGVGIFILVLMTILSGLTEKTIWVVSNYQDLPSEGILVNFIALFIASFGILTLYLVNEIDYKRNNLPEDEVQLAQTQQQQQQQ